MSINDIIAIYQTLLPFGMGVASVLTFLLFKGLISGYLPEKGKNLATKEDIAAITEKIESVKQQYSEMLEGLKTKNQLRVSALEQRLRAHQEAYQLWREINGALGHPEIDGVVQRCDKWWGENCLYLEPAARSSFLLAFVHARHLPSYKREAGKDLEGARDLAQIYREINDTGGIIEECVSLPKLKEPEIKAKGS